VPEPTENRHITCLYSCSCSSPYLSTPYKRGLMHKITRMLSGALFGGALMVAVQALTPHGLMAQAGGFCDESGGKTYCCSTDANGNIKDCKVVTALQ
jgi:hypothetical protein